MLYHSRLIRGYPPLYGLVGKVEFCGSKEENESESVGGRDQGRMLRNWLKVLKVHRAWTSSSLGTSWRDQVARETSAVVEDY